MSHPPQPAQTISLSFQALCPSQVPCPLLCMHKPLPYPLASAGPCTGLWAGLASVPLLLPCGRADITGGFQTCWGLLQDAHRTLGVGCQALVQGRKGCPFACLVSTLLPVSSCIPLPSLHA